MPKKRKSRKKKQKIEAGTLSFVAVLALFAGFSVYSFVSFFNSTNDYIASFYNASVLDIEAPGYCQTCPDTPECSSVCVDNQPEQEEEVDQPYPIFVDFMSDHPNADAVEALLFAGIVGGYDDGTLKPDNSINRAELLTVITTAVDADLSGDYSNCFEDVTSEWFAPYACYAKANGWVGGYDDGTYRPANIVIKAETLKILLVAFGFELDTDLSELGLFPDVSEDQWYAPYVITAYNYGVISSGNFNAGSEMTRIQVFQMVYDAMLAKGLL